MATRAQAQVRDEIQQKAKEYQSMRTRPADDHGMAFPYPGIQEQLSGAFAAIEELEERQSQLSGYLTPFLRAHDTDSEQGQVQTLGSSEVGNRIASLTERIHIVRRRIQALNEEFDS